MKSQYSIIGIRGLMIGLGVAGVSFVALVLVVWFFILPGLLGEPSLEITVHNQTDETLMIFNSDTLVGNAVPEENIFIGNAIPGEKVKFYTGRIYPGVHDIIIAKDLEGNVVYSANLTGEDLERKRTYRVVIPPMAKGVEQSDNVTGR